jgi:hypothetical protein
MTEDTLTDLIRYTLNFYPVNARVSSASTAEVQSSWKFASTLVHTWIVWCLDGMLTVPLVISDIIVQKIIEIAWIFFSNMLVICGIGSRSGRL